MSFPVSTSTSTSSCLLYRYVDPTAQEALPFDTHNSLLFALQQSRYAKPLASSPTETSTAMKRRSVCLEYSEARVWSDSSRVSHLSSPHRNDLHQHLGSQVPLDSRLYHFQEPYHYLDRIRRGPLVWRCCHAHGSIFFRIDGLQLRHCGLGRHSACFG